MAQIRYVSSPTPDGLARDVGRIIGKYETAQVSVQVLVTKEQDRRNPDGERTVYQAFIVCPSG